MQTPTLNFRVMLTRQTYTNMLYLALSFPLGLFYFIIIVTGIAVGLGTLVVWVGVLILLLTFSAWWRFASFERSLAIRWLQVDIAPLEGTAGRSRNWLVSLPVHLSDPMTWKTLAFLLLKLPIGIGSFCMLLALLIISIGITVPSLVLGVLAAPFVLVGMALHTMSRPTQHWKEYLWLVLSGFGLHLLTLQLFNGIALSEGQLARSLLGMSDTTLRLDAARTQVEQAEQRRRELIVNVSHELRAPVASIAGHLESLVLSTEEGTKTPPPATLYNYLTIAIKRRSVWAYS